MNNRFLVAAVAFSVVTLTLDAAAPKRTGAGAKSVSGIPGNVQKAMDVFSASSLKAHMRYLSSDLLEGRGPGTRGDHLATSYIAAQFEAAGLQPAGDNGTFFQRVPLVGVDTDDAKTTLAFVRPGAQPVALKYLDDYVVTNETQMTSTDLEADLVFVGHGVVAPEFEWDDYKGLDVRGKVLLMLVDDPPANAAEPNRFGGKARTYYGRWTYKYDVATKMGAAGVILIHTDQSAGYRWSVVRNSWGRERSYVKVAKGAHALSMASWITKPVAEALMVGAGQNLEALTEAASKRDFKPVALGTKAQATLITAVREIETSNVLAKLPGSDSILKDEAVVYSAHHDHLGIATPEDGDAIYNGALDNASGSALLIELARVWKASGVKPKRTILFAAVAAEEQGLLGSAYYGANPAIAAGKTALNLNFDSIEQFGRVKNVTIAGAERTTFYPVAQRVTKALGIRIDPDEHPEQGSYYRSDHFSMAKFGIPAFSVNPGSEYVGRSKDWGEKQFKDYNQNRYHQPDDEFDETWDFSQGVQIGQLGFWLGWEAANLATLPTWKAGDEFLAAREKSLGR